MKNKADLDSIYRADLLTKRKIIDTLFHPGEIWELVLLNGVGSYPANKLTCINK